MLAPPIAALAGAGWAELWSRYHNRSGWKMWLLPTAILVTTAFELYVLQPYGEQIGHGWMIGIGGAGLILSLLLLLATRKEKLSRVAAVAAMLVLLVAPAYWAATPLLYGDNSMLPQAGPKQQMQAGPGPQAALRQQAQVKTVSPGSNQNTGRQQGTHSGSQDKLLEYVTRHNTGETFLFATTDANTAESYIIKTSQAVMAMGGFSGNDPILTVAKIKQLVAEKKVKFFLIPSGSGGGPGGGSSEVLNWIRAHSTEVPQSEWQSGSSQAGPMGMGNNRTLYQIKIEG